MYSFIQQTLDLLSTKKESLKLTTFSLMYLLGSEQKKKEEITEQSVYDVAKLSNLI